MDKDQAGKKALGAAARVAGIYGCLGLLWIYFSDKAVEVLFPSPHLQTAVQTYKGSFFILGTTLVLFALIGATTRRLLLAQRGVERLEREIVERLSLAAEYRDDETGNHVRRVGQYCGALARAIGMTPEQASSIELAACLHDLGKIGIPDHVMLKEGVFDEEDRKVMRAHTLIGSSLLSGGETEVMQVAERIALTHHEHWDGCGYPGGLKGEEIPIEGRICALADVFDALVTRRRYKVEWPVERAIAELKNQSGAQFDPTLVDAFISILPEIERVRSAYPDMLTDDSRYLAAA